MIYNTTTDQPNNTQSMKIVEFHLPPNASAGAAKTDALKAMRERSYKPNPDTRYRIDFVNRSEMSAGQIPSCMSKTIDGIAEALRVDRLALLIWYQQADVTTRWRSVDVIISEVQS